MLLGKWRPSCLSPNVLSELPCQCEIHDNHHWCPAFTHTISKWKHFYPHSHESISNIFFLHIFITEHSLVTTRSIFPQSLTIDTHDDAIKWKHFLHYWPFVRGIHRSPVNSPHKDQWRGALRFSLIYTRINKRLSKQWWGWWFESTLCPLWCHYNATIYHHWIRLWLSAYPVTYHYLNQCYFSLRIQIYITRLQGTNFQTHFNFKHG